VIAGARPSARHPRACRGTAGRLPCSRASSCSTVWRSPTRTQRCVALWMRAPVGPPAVVPGRACAGPVPCAEVRWSNSHGRWRRHVPREQHDHAHAGGAPGPAHTRARARALVALVSGAGTGTGTGLDAVPSRQHETAARTHARTHACTHARMHAALVVLVSAALVLELALD
jgi:hypothetical protein